MAHHPTDPALREALSEHRQKFDLTNSALGKLLGVTATFISKYINDNLDHNPNDFDARAWDTLRAIERKLELEKTLFETSVSRAIAGRIEMARRTSDVCALHGASGEGKTSSALLYLAANPSSLYYKVCGNAVDARALQSAIFKQLALRDFDYTRSRWDIIVENLRGSQRALIIDNAHRLARSGRDWIFDLNEETGIAGILIGTEDLLKKIKSDAQQYSRIGVAGIATYETKDGKKELAKVARNIAIQFSSPEFVDEISDLAEFVATRAGRLRNVRKTTILAREIAAKNGTPPRQAFRQAHSQLVNDCILPAD